MVEAKSRFYSWEQVQGAVISCSQRANAFIKEGSGKPLIIAIGGGGYTPARVLRTDLEDQSGDRGQVPIIGVSLQNPVYRDDFVAGANSTIQVNQWFDPGSGYGRLVDGGRVIIVDEVYDSGATVLACVEKLMREHKPEAVAVVVVHNKRKPKVGQLPDGVTLIAGEEVPDEWCCYPCDASKYGLTPEQHRLKAVRHAEQSRARWAWIGGSSVLAAAAAALFFKMR